MVAEPLPYIAVLESVLPQQQEFCIWRSPDDISCKAAPSPRCPGAGARRPYFRDYDGACAIRAGRTEWRHGVSLFGDVKYPAGFKRFDYVNPDAPKGGVARQIRSAPSTTSTSSSPASRARRRRRRLIYETLMSGVARRGLDRIRPARRSGQPSGRFFLGDLSAAPEARWHDGKPVTPEDVIFSLDAFKKISPHVHRPITGMSSRPRRPATTTSRSPSMGRATANCRRSSDN